MHPVPEGFKITKVEATKPTVPLEKTFMEKIEGIVTVSIASLAVLVIVLAIFCIKSAHKKR